jgi:hypothetical protein
VTPVAEKEQRIVPAPPGDVDEGQAVGVTGADPRLAPGYVHCDAHPDHGEPVVYTPGELLPDWVRVELAGGGALAVTGPGHFRLVPAKAPQRKARS